MKRKLEIEFSEFAQEELDSRLLKYQITDAIADSSCGSNCNCNCNCGGNCNCNCNGGNCNCNCN